MFVFVALLILVAHFSLAFFATRAFAINALLGCNIVHAGTGKHSLSARDVAAVRSDVNRPNGLTARRVQGHDPDRVAMMIGAQSVTRAIKTRSRLVCSVSRNRERSVR